MCTGPQLLNEYIPIHWIAHAQWAIIEWPQAFVSINARIRLCSQNGGYEKALLYSMNTYPIGDSPLEISAARRSFAPLQNRAEITVLICEQRSYPVSVSSSAKALL